MTLTPRVMVCTAAVVNVEPCMPVALGVGGGVGVGAVVVGAGAAEPGVGVAMNVVVVTIVSRPVGQHRWLAPGQPAASHSPPTHVYPRGSLHTPMESPPVNGYLDPHFSTTAPLVQHPSPPAQRPAGDAKVPPPRQSNLAASAHAPRSAVWRLTKVVAHVSGGGVGAGVGWAGAGVAGAVGVLRARGRVGVH